MIHSIGSIPPLKVEEVIALSRKLILTATELDLKVFNEDPKRVQTVNLQHLYLASRDQEFRNVLWDADLITADGWPVVALFKSCGLKASRVTGSDFVVRLTRGEVQGAMRIGLLGGSIPEGRRFAAQLGEVGTSLVYREHGQASSWEMDSVVGELNSAGVDLLLVAVTSPKGEYVAAALSKGGFAGTVICVGGAIQMASDLKLRAPRFLQRIGLEWAFRLCREPRRLWRRYLVEGVAQAIMVVLPLCVRLRFSRPGGEPT